MGFIKAFAGSLSGTFADQWKDFYTVKSGLTATTILTPAVKKGVNAGRGENTKGYDNVISNGSKIVVPEGFGLVTMQDGKVTGYIDEAGGYEYRNDDINSKSIYAGNKFLTVFKATWDKVKFGGIPSAEQLAFFVNLKEIPGNKFGTQSEIYFDDAFLGTQVGATTRGSYTLKVVNPLLFITGFIPVAHLTSDAQDFDLADMTNEVGTQLFNEVVSSLAPAFSAYVNDSSKSNRITKIQSDSIGFAKALDDEVEKNYQWKSLRGLEIINVSIIAIEYDKDTKALLSDVKKADALSGGRGNSFMQQSVARGIQSAGENGGGEGIAFMGMGLNGANGMMGGLSQNISQKEQLAEKKKMLDEGLITQEDYDAFKKKLLGI